MNLSQHIRILSENAFTRQSKLPGHPPTPDMRPFLAVPIRERLVLLAIYDGQPMEVIKGAYPWAKETDVRRTSHRIQDALAIFNAALKEPTAWINPGPYPVAEVDGDLGYPDTPFPINSRTIPADTDKQFRQAWFPSTPLMLFGAHVPPAMSQLSLKRRSIVYLAVVEEWSYSQIMETLECSKRQVHTSLIKAIEALGG